MEDIIEIEYGLSGYTKTTKHFTDNCIEVTEEDYESYESYDNCKYYGDAPETKHNLVGTRKHMIDG